MILAIISYVGLAVALGVILGWLGEV